MDDENVKTADTPGGRGLVLSIVATVIVVAATALYIWRITYKPAYGATQSAQGAVAVSTLANGQKAATVNLNILPAVGVGPNAPWLGYQTRTASPHPGTIFTLPAHALVTVIIHNFDGQTALRNTFFTLVQGTVGGTESVNGKPIKVMDPNLTSHTFTIADLGVSVPMAGVPSNAKPTDYETMKFTFRTGAPGHYRWQCIVPCGWGLYGNGGPMQEMGYMDGMITVA
ncbi:MAG: hypothetical protein ACR2JC_07285 [Chloroflexota bacterium]|nr:MAG: hypothetical protein DLM70_14800 [Chloroflexota bacterium]